MAWAVPNPFWREIHDRMKERDPEFLLLDETIPYIADFQAGLFDMHFDSTTYAALRRVGRGDAPATTLLDAVDERGKAGFPEYAAFMLYAENHDETRYIVECGREAADAALGALFTLPGAPMVYAGQEFGQRGKRDALAWEHGHQDLREHVERLAAARHDESALGADASLDRLDVDVREGKADRVVAYRRESDDDAVTVVVNFADEPATVAVDAADSVDVVTGADLATESGRVAVDSVAVLPAE
jgi:glycosidase